jgi:hypothetical protein
MPHAKRQKRFVSHVTRDLTARGLRAALVRRRLHAYFHVIALHMWNTARGATTAVANDSEDFLSLMHVGEPAFLVTRDHGLIKAVDAPKTYQAPWCERWSNSLGCPADWPPMGHQCQAPGGAVRPGGGLVGVSDDGGARVR